MSCPIDANHVAHTSIQHSIYIRERLNPQPGESFYLHLVDLRQALQSFATETPLRVLDYGAGGSPYRSLFSHADYRRADFDAVGGMDYVLKGEDTSIPEPDGAFDLILSTQVAEHLRWPQRYLAECRRLLKPGGRLLCTTHGVFEEHGCPYDYQRWTAAGLREAVQEAGFLVEETQKLTTGARALLFVLDQHLQTLGRPHGSLWGWIVRLVQRLYHRNRAYVHRQADRHYAANRAVPESEPGHSFYIALMVLAQKPV